MVLTAIRPRLAVLATVAAAPLFGLLVIAGVENRSVTLTAAVRQVETLAHIASERQDTVIQEGAHLLTVLARVPEVRAFGPNCHPLLHQVGEDQPHFAVITAVRPDGAVGCMNITDRISFNLADRSYFNAALGTHDGSVVSEVVGGRLSGRPTVILARPIPGDGADDPASGVIIASLDLSAFLLPNQDQRPDDMESRVVDSRHADVLTIDPGGRQSEARRVVPAVMAAIARHPEGGTYIGPDIDGVSTLFGFAPLASTQQNLYVVLDRPLAMILAEANQRIGRDLTVGAVTLAIALLGAWLVGQRSLVAPVSRLATFAGRIGQGELAAPPPRLPGAALELQLLGTAFATMAQRLHARDTELAAMQAAVAESEEHHRLLAENTTDLITLIGPDMIRTYASPACRDVLGREPETLIGHGVSSWVHPEDQPSMGALFKAFEASANMTDRWEYRALHSDGRPLWLESAARRLPNGRGFVVSTRDVTQRRATEEKLEAANRLLRVQALQDPLTGIANRRRFDEALGMEFRRAQRLAAPLSILMIDIDHFKSFNDTYGHPAGDSCLRAVARRIEAQLGRPGDLLGRYGGEEFGCVLPGVDPDGALTVAEQIRAAVEELQVVNADSPHGILTVSIGVATIDPPRGDEGPAEYVEAADMALYQAKHSGRNTVCVAQPQRA